MLSISKFLFMTMFIDLFISRMLVTQIPGCADGLVIPSKEGLYTNTVTLKWCTPNGIKQSVIYAHAYRSLFLVEKQNAWRKKKITFSAWEEPFVLEHRKKNCHFLHFGEGNICFLYFRVTKLYMYAGVRVGYVKLRRGNLKIQKFGFIIVHVYKIYWQGN